MELDLEQEEIDIEFLNYIYLYSIVQEFVIFSYTIYNQEKSINIFDNDKEIRVNVRLKTSKKEEELFVNIGYLNFKYDEDLKAKRKQKIIEFFKLNNENEINENIITKLNENFKQIDEILSNNSILEEIIGRTYKSFCINMNKIILNLFKTIKDMRKNFETIINDTNKKFENMENIQMQFNNKNKLMEEKLNELISLNQEQKKKIEEQEKKIEELQIKNVQKDQTIEIMKNNYANLEKKFNTLNSKFDNLKNLSIQFIQIDEDIAKILKKKEDLKLKIFNLTSN